MNKLHLAFAALALTAGCASGGGNAAGSTPAVSQPVVPSRVAMRFAPAANAKKVVVSVDGEQSPPLTIGTQPQTANLPDNVAVTVTCGTASGGSTSGPSAASGSAQTCTVATLLPPGQYQISVAQLDFLNGLVADLSQFITLAAGTNFFGDFFGSSPTPAPGPTAS